MSNLSAKPGNIFPDIQVSTRDGEELSLIPRVKPDMSDSENTWYVVVVYRGKHCPICAKYLNQLAQKQKDFADINTKIVAVSSDSVEQLNAFYESDIADVEFPVYADLKLDVAKNLGLYLSAPMSDSETDHVFTEPALFVINHKREIQIVEIANAPFVRPNIDILLGGIKFTRENDYPIRGTHTE